MITRYFVLDDVSSAEYGIYMSGWPSFSAPSPKVEKVSVPGRNGDLVFEDGSFDNVEGVLKCFILHEQTYDSVAEANGWLCKGGYRRLTYDGDVNAYRLARIVNGAEMAVRMKRLDPFEIKLDCKPQRFLLSGEIPVTYTSSGILDCPAYEGLPLVRVYGTSGTVTINGKTIDLHSIDDYVDIDCELQDAYKGDINHNSSISCSEFPKLSYGENAIILSSGITKVEVTPRWFTL